MLVCWAAQGPEVEGVGKIPVAFPKLTSLSVEVDFATDSGGPYGKREGRAAFVSGAILTGLERQATPRAASTTSLPADG